jgi:hypothetical protein
VCRSAAAQESGCAARLHRYAVEVIVAAHGELSDTGTSRPPLRHARFTVG